MWMWIHIIGTEAFDYKPPILVHIDYLVLVIGEQYGCSVELAERIFGVNPDRSVKSL